MPADRYPGVDATGDPHPIDAPFRLDVTVRRDFTPDAPALLRGSFENRSDERRAVGFGPVAPFSSVWSEDGSLVLLPSDRDVQRDAFGTEDPLVPDHPVDGCWRTRPVRFIRHDVLRWHTLAPGERVETEYLLLQYAEPERSTTAGLEAGPGDDERCLPAGTYRFEESFPPKIGRNEPWTAFDWGFTLTLVE